MVTGRTSQEGGYLGSHHWPYERNEIKPSIEIAKKIEDIEALTDKEKEKIFDYIDLVIRDVKIKKAPAS